MRKEKGLLAPSLFVATKNSVVQPHRLHILHWAIRGLVDLVGRRCFGLPQAAQQTDAQQQ